jgi:hypothetical protein
MLDSFYSLVFVKETLCFGSWRWFRHQEMYETHTVGSIRWKWSLSPDRQLPKRRVHVASARATDTKDHTRKSHASAVTVFWHDTRQDKSILFPFQNSLTQFWLQCDVHSARSPTEDCLFNIFFKKKTHGTLPGKFSLFFLNFKTEGFAQILDQTMISANLGSSSTGNRKSFEYDGTWWYTSSNT